MQRTFKHSHPGPDRVMQIRQRYRRRRLPADRSRLARLQPPSPRFARLLLARHRERRRHGLARRRHHAARLVAPTRRPPVPGGSRPSPGGRCPQEPTRNHRPARSRASCPFLRGCVATLVPLRWESGTRFKILEAFACRAPVISTTRSAPKELAVTHGQDILLADDSEAFADAILALLEDRAAASTLTGPAIRPRSARLRRQALPLARSRGCSTDWAWARREAYAAASRWSIRAPTSTPCPAWSAPPSCSRSTASPSTSTLLSRSPASPRHASPTAHQPALARRRRTGRSLDR